MSRKSKFLALVLRHNPSLIGLSMDRYGWVRVDEFLNNCETFGVPFKNKGRPYTREELFEIVSSDDKGRFVLNELKTKIRAVHGHSADVETDLVGERPPNTLYHGTTGRFLDDIFSQGIMPMKRRFVHLSETVDQAISVGSRHGSPVILEVDACRLYEFGEAFFRSESAVWLTGRVPQGYFRVYGPEVVSSCGG